MHKLILSILLVTCTAAYVFAGPIENGFWVKVKIPKQGVYRVSYNELASAGFDVTNLDPRKLQLRGHQGGMIPEFNGKRRVGLPEIPIWIEGEADGKFDQSDYLLFYAGSTSKWNYNGSSGWSHQVNDYSNTAYLYLGLSSENGIRVNLQPSIAPASQQVITTTDYLYFHDSDMVNPAEMGRVWLGEKFGNETLKRNFLFQLPSGCADSAKVKVAYAAGLVESVGDMNITVNGIKTSERCSFVDPEYMAFYEDAIQKWYKSSTGQISVNMELIRPNTNSAAWLNYIEIQSPRKIEITSEPIIIRSDNLQKGIASEVRASGSNNIRFWGVSDEGNPREYESKVAGSSYSYFLTDNQTIDKVFVAFDADKCLKVNFSGVVKNANILSGEAVNLIIIAHPDFLTPANDLASFRRQNDNYAVKVVTPQSIYDEYSASMQDAVAIRDYIREEFKKSELANTELKYVLLFGSGSYDFKDRVANNTNRVPTYEDFSSIKSGTFCLDDFYGYLDSNMGRPSLDPNKLRLAIGRIPVRTKQEAEGVVNKLKRYYSPKSLGPWRAGLSFVCDDIDKDYEDIFTKESEQFSSAISKVHPDIQVDKIYADAYKQVTNGNTEQYPSVSSAINYQMNNGCLFMNYQGHGGEKGWAQEQILTIPQINSWNNNWTMPVLFTATCEFSRYDDPGFQSAGELTLLNPNGGAIALMTTTRLVYVSGNSQINYDFWTNYGFPKPNEPVPTVGDLFKRMKNRPSITSEDNKFALLGDPSMRLAFPTHKAIIDSVNGKDALQFVDTIKAFSIVKLKGHIEKRLGGKYSDFNGTMWVKVLDKAQNRYTLDNDKLNKKIQYKDQTSLIFKGIVTVTNGDFSVVFSVPKDIAYNVDFGKIMLYAHNGITDASGAKEILIGGSESEIAPDSIGPTVKLYMNDTTFSNGGDVQKDAVFIAKIYDESGINATGAGIGRDLIGILDKGTTMEKSIIMNDFFSYQLNSFRNGIVNYSFKDLEIGEHRILFKVWDIHNNSSEAELKFVVKPENTFHIISQSVYPNPFQQGNAITIEFEHNKAGEDIGADLEIYNGSGLRIYEKHYEIYGAMSKESSIKWDGQGLGNSFVPSGFYFYKLLLRASDGSRANIQGKMIKN